MFYNLTTHFGRNLMVEISKAYDMKNISIAFLVYAYVIIFTKTLKYRLKFSIFGVMDNTIMVNDIYTLVLEPSYCKGPEQLPSCPSYGRRCKYTCQLHMDISIIFIIMLYLITSIFLYTQTFIGKYSQVFIT
jgi:hypothetical protein